MLNTPQRRPIRKQPTKFTANVAKGNPLLRPFMANDTRYRPAPPKKLPAPTANNVFNNSIDTILFANHLQKALIVHLLVRNVFAVTQHSPLLNGRKGRNSGHDGDGDHGPEKSRND